MRFNKTAESVFASPASIGVLRFFVTSRPEMTGREVAGFCGLSHTHALRALASLESQGVILRSRAGRAYLFRLNDKSAAVRTLFGPFFDKEKTLLRDAVSAALRGIKKNILSAVVFGSASRGEERPDSDVDLFILARSAADVPAIEKHLADAEVDFCQSTGSRLAPVIMTSAGMKKKMKSAHALFESIDAGTIVFGRRPYQEVSE